MKGGIRSPAIPDMRSFRLLRLLVEWRSPAISIQPADSSAGRCVLLPVQDVKMAAGRALCTNADCHKDSSGPPGLNFCPACGSELITACPRCQRPIAEMADPWPILCDKCGAPLRHRLKQSYFGVM